MKKYFSLGSMAILALLFFSGVLVNKAQAQVGISASITFQNFYDDLAPYGNWIEYPGYGHVWHPSVAGDFRPYLTNGYWNYTDEGWLWNSNYPWGWAPFHYGRWIFDNYYGWFWIPGYEWSPAWVTWGDYDDYYAWAPLMPNVNVGFAFNSWRPSSFYWNVVGRDHMYDRDIDHWEKGRDFCINPPFNSMNKIDQYFMPGVLNQLYLLNTMLRLCFGNA
ncbi:MAG: hypothetical protein MUO53_05345 [Maribacter sp.]|nr:hypothetical protein [Maribacter sp.]